MPTPKPQPERVTPYHPSRAEQETIIRWDREDPQAHVFSASPVVWRKLARLGLEPVRRSHVREVEVGRFYVVPLARLRWSIARERVEGAPKRTGNAAALAAARARKAQEPERGRLDALTRRHRETS